MSLLNQLEEQVSNWVKQTLPDPQLQTQGPWVRPCTDPRHGHYQSNVAMVSAKALKKNPREIAAQLVAFFDGKTEWETPEMAGPGFVNFRYTQKAVEDAVSGFSPDTCLGIPAEQRRTIVIDFSSPNVAKEMHVGHIRSTILGDTLARVARALGHHVITDNHIGDWGTQFGKVLLGYKKAGKPELTPDNALAELEKFYQEIHQLSGQDATVLEQARDELRKLQDGDEENLGPWRRFIEYSQKAADLIYSRLDVHFDYTLGESYYNSRLKSVVRELQEKGIAEESEGAMVVFFPGNKELEDHPCLIQKSDGAALYATTDLATIEYRIDEFKADTMIYVTDGRQQLHLKQVFEVARRWGVQSEFEHVWFGAILGEDKKPLKTRDGNPIKLRDLLDEAENRAAAILKEKRPDLSEEAIREKAVVIGIGALKYADQAQNRNLDYVFNWEKLLAFDGNTAPYCLNAYVRTRSILRKAAVQAPITSPIQIAEELELDLCRKILEFEDVVRQVGREHRPHYLCLYLFELSGLFHKFFEHCPVLRASSEELKQSRLRLCQLTGVTLAKGLDLLGIKTLEEM